MSHAHLLRPPGEGKPIAFVAPTLRCNLSCENCITAGIEDGPEMSLDEYLGLARRLSREAGGCEVCMVGGEPSLWPCVDEALSGTHALEDMDTSFFTNCARRLRVLPHTLYFSMNTLGAAGETARKRSLDVFASYHADTGPEFELNVRFVVDWRTDDASIGELMKILDLHPRAGVSLGFDFRFFERPASRDPRERARVGMILTRLFDDVWEKRAAGAEIQDLFPLCLFGDENLDRLRGRYPVAGRCAAPHNSTLFLPGGAIQACPGVPARQSWPAGESLADLVRKFLPECENRRALRPAFCRDCSHGTRGECQAGCLCWRPDPIPS